jgi:glycosyltransferase involved in cell wall biosynthesis
MARVSVIVPCYNEEKTIGFLLNALYQQTYNRSDLEVVIADGLSTDGTLEQIQIFQDTHPDLQIRVIDNVKRTIPSGLNLAVRNSTGELIVRLDAHSMPYADYIAKCVDNLLRGLGDNVGGVWEIRPGGTNWLAKSIALAAANPLGVGDARYRYTTRTGAVDTVPFGAYRRSLIERVGYYNEQLLTNEDYEFNTRIRQSGGTIWLDPEIRTVYFARSNLASLANQYWRYGYWKLRMLRKYPETIRWRQALPPLFVAGLFVFSILAFFLPVMRWFLLFMVSTYLAILLVAGLILAMKNRDLMLIPGIPLSIGVMHLSWGSAFLWSLVGR